MGYPPPDECPEQEDCVGTAAGCLGDDTDVIRPLRYVSDTMNGWMRRTGL